MAMSSLHEERASFKFNQMEKKLDSMAIIYNVVIFYWVRGKIWVLRHDLKSKRTTLVIKTLNVSLNMSKSMKPLSCGF